MRYASAKKKNANFMDCIYDTRTAIPRVSYSENPLFAANVDLSLSPSSVTQPKLTSVAVSVVCFGSSAVERWTIS